MVCLRDGPTFVCISMPAMYKVFLVYDAIYMVIRMQGDMMRG